MAWWETLRLDEDDPATVLQHVRDILHTPAPPADTAVTADGTRVPRESPEG